MDAAERILPERVRAYLHTTVLGRRIYYYPRVDSTNRAALELARLGEAEGTVVLTDHQTHGRGRGDHVWHSPAGKDLLFTVVLRPGGHPRDVLPVTLAVSLALSVSLSKALDVEVGVKWPNDVVAGGAKIAGILAESSSRAGTSTFVVVGVGINVNSTPDDFPAELRATATSCAAVSGVPLERAALAADALGAIESYYHRFRADGFAALAGAYTDRMTLLGRRVTFAAADGSIGRGRVVGVRDDGALLLEGDDGSGRALITETLTGVS